LTLCFALMRFLDGFPAFFACCDVIVPLQQKLCFVAHGSTHPTDKVTSH